MRIKKVWLGIYRLQRIWAKSLAMSSNFARYQEIKTLDRASDMIEWVNSGMVQLLVVKFAGFSEINSLVGHPATEHPDNMDLVNGL